MNERLEVKNVRLHKTYIEEKIKEESVEDALKKVARPAHHRPIFVALLSPTTAGIPMTSLMHRKRPPNPDATAISLGVQTDIPSSQAQITRNTPTPTW